MNDLHLCELMAQCLRGLAGEGYALEQECDLYEGERRALRVRNKERSAPFSLRFNDPVQSDVFWLFLRKGGRDIGCVAARRDSLRRGELPRYLRQSYLRLYGDEHLSTIPTPPAILGEMQGNVIYLGEFYVKDRFRQNRNLLRRYVHALFVLCCQSLSADWLYAFIPKDHDAFGLGRVYGFQYFDDTALVWDKVPVGRRPETLCVISRGQIYERAAHYRRYPQDFEIPESALQRDLKERVKV